MSGTYLYCQNPECGVYLGSLGGDQCGICYWGNPEQSGEERGEEAGPCENLDR